MMPVRKPKSCRHRRCFGGNVAALRAQQGLTQEKLAERAGLSARYVQSIEAGEYFPSLATLVRLRTAASLLLGKIISGLRKGLTIYSHVVPGNFFCKPALSLG